MMGRNVPAVLALSVTLASGAAAQQPDAFANYDFTRGDRNLFAEDLSQDRVGNFPRRLNLVRGRAASRTGGSSW